MNLHHPPHPIRRDTYNTWLRWRADVNRKAGRRPRCECGRYGRTGDREPWTCGPCLVGVSE